MMERKTVVLDPGHGGTSVAGGSTPNRGIGANGVFEKDVALDLATRIREQLRDDFTVVLTRENDRNLALAERAASARRVAADMFVSIHLSGAPGQVSSSTDVITARGANPASRALAASMHAHVGRATGSPGSFLEADLGQLAVRRHAPATAACLVEVASLDDSAQAARLADPAYLDQLAGAFADSVRERASSPVAVAQWVGTAGRSPLVRSAAVLVPDIDYSVTSLADAGAIWARWFERYGAWYAGVPDHTVMSFPHGAICQLVLTDTSGTRTGYGTGFYIADEVLLTCGHNFYLPSRNWETGSVEVQPGHSPTATTYATRSFAVNAQDVVHPRWWNSGGGDPGHDLAVLHVPGLPSQVGSFSLANMSMEPSTPVVVSGYGKDRAQGPSATQPQRMDGATITRVDPELAYYPIQTLPGHSGSPLFYEHMVIGVHRAAESQHENEAALLTPDKNDWIVRQAGGGVAIGLSHAASSPVGRALTVTSNSTQQEQSDEVRVKIARSVAQWESGGAYDQVHDDSNRINFGLGSWTGVRIADVLDRYVAFAAREGLTAELHAHFGGEGQLDEIRRRFRTDGVATVLSPAERAQLRALGGDARMTRAQDEHLAEDLRADLDAIGGGGPPWYPFIDAGMGAITEIAAHVLVHARHQAGSLGGVLNDVIAHFGGDAPLGQGMVNGTITERDVLDQVAEEIISRVAQRYRAGVRNRYNWLFANFANSDLSYYFLPQ